MAARPILISARSPFQEDVDIDRLARSLGFVLVRRTAKIEIYDERALVAAGLTSKEPKLDFPRIARLLDMGPIEGARWNGIEYTLRTPEDVEIASTF